MRPCQHLLRAVIGQSAAAHHGRLRPRPRAFVLRQEGGIVANRGGRRILSATELGAHAVLGRHADLGRLRITPSTTLTR